MRMTAKLVEMVMDVALAAMMLAACLIGTVQYVVSQHIHHSVPKIIFAEYM